ncbi:MAG: chorismate mutase [Acholeplasmataceae bacterium]
MDLKEYRKQIDEVDLELMELFKRRMRISKAIGDYKKEHDIPIFDASREIDVVIERREQFADETLWPLYHRFLQLLFELSKEVQK